ncbi:MULTISPECIES: COQ9 family protein [unclassified Sphingomonas]|uniref:COQ9 family protein n=1 Tax=unclassified Sphingomonas TaxID=196159 RepID=UPI0006FDBFB1|nr:MULTISPECIES: COQ9 family protein [unclassified Sphingomonas]KQX20872.1 RpsU-divergently transcribed [Sphingomonas sp. Root1294]KQY68718.1 RpsU-divergently transcribed [Sphingomonas sp. Root50]KRB88122.1 RpsU-divergently transcribed [Sphingomonas sp. Root720]
MTAPIDMTLDELRMALADVLPAHAAFDGWGDVAIAGAAAELAVPADRAALCFPNGAIDMIDAWFEGIDRSMAAKLAALDLPSMKIRDRIRAAVTARLDAATRHPDALRRALAILARPAHVAHAGKLAWRASDGMWRAIGDGSVDVAWYSKRATLTALYVATMTAWMDDDSEGFADTRAFLDRRIDDVMKIEKLKARLKPDPYRHFSPARFLGRLRYRIEG